jgi:uncharacterized protein YcfJ
MRTVKLLSALLALTAVASLATAGNNYRDVDYSYAPVVDVQPIYEQYQVPQNRQVCGDHRGRQYPNRQHRSNGGGALLGAILGGVIGNRFGKGNGRKASTAAGVMIGASIGSQAKTNKHYPNQRYGNQRNSCYTQRDYITEERITGYEVSYDYNGRIYQTRMQNHPGDQVRIQINHQVAEY